MFFNVSTGIKEKEQFKHFRKKGLPQSENNI
jgi:hypothetical protein